MLNQITKCSISNPKIIKNNKWRSLEKQIFFVQFQQKYEAAMCKYLLLNNEKCVLSIKSS